MYNIYETVMLSSNTDEVVMKIFQVSSVNITNSDKRTDIREFKFKAVRRLIIRCEKVIALSGLSFIKPPNYLDIKVLKFFHSIMMIDAFQYVMMLTPYQKGRKNHRKSVTYIRPFIKNYNCDGINNPVFKKIF